MIALKHITNTGSRSEPKWIIEQDRTYHKSDTIVKISATGRSGIGVPLGRVYFTDGTDAIVAGEPAVIASMIESDLRQPLQLELPDLTERHALAVHVTQQR